jgi:hypothetical protein
MRCWRVRLSFRDWPLVDRVLPGGASLTIGEGGDVVVPGIGGVVPLLVAGEMCPPPATAEVKHHDSPGGMMLRPTAHPEVELRLDCEVLERGRFREGLLRLPTREALYGMAAAVCLASLIAVDVAVSPARTTAPEPVTPDERSLLVQAMFSVPPPEPPRSGLPSAGLAGFEPVADEPTAPEPEDEDELALLEGSVPDLLAEPLPEAIEPAPVQAKKPRRAKKRDDTPKALAGVFRDEIADGQSSVLGALIAEDETFGIGGLGVAKLDRIEAAPSDVLGGVVGGVVDEPLPDLVATIEGGVEGGIAAIADVRPPAADEAARTQPGQGAPGCEMELRPKAQTQVVFVIDVASDTGPALASVLAGLGPLDQRIRQNDSAPGYGVVLFDDEVRMPAGARPVAREALRASLERARDAIDERNDDDRPEDERGSHRGLAALERAATAFAWGDEQETLRLVVYLSADQIDSGDGAKQRYRRTVRALQDRNVRVASFTPRHDAEGKAAGLGFWQPLRAEEPIPAATAGLAFTLPELASSRGGIGSALQDLLKNPVCKKNAIFGTFE